jgi:cell division protein FtsB
MTTRRLLIGFLALANLFLAGHLLLGGQGAFAYLELRQRHAAVARELAAAEERARDLSREIRLLKGDDEHLGEVIRRRMNYVQQGEVLYLFTSRPAGAGGGQTPGAEPDGH